MDLKKYEKLDKETKDLLTDWFVKTGEVITALGVEGIEPLEAMKFLRGILVVKNLKYIDS